ncbi:hypothetical protein INT43_005951, partial [Umbelopsis isabellina]
MEMRASDTRQYGHGTFTPEETVYLQNTLQKQLGPEWISRRPGHGASTMSYLEGHSSINLANKIFGFNGWSSEIKSITTDHMEVTDGGRYNVCISVIMRITLKDGTFHEDIGMGSIENCKSKTQAIGKAKKEAATDATKRALRYFGTVMGNCIYDKYYTQQIAKVGLPPVSCEKKRFDSNELFRANAPALPLMAPAPVMTSYPNTATIPPVNNNSVHNVRNHQEDTVRQSTSNGSSSSLRQSLSAVSAPMNQLMAVPDNTVEVKRDQQEDSFISYDDDPSLYAQIDEEAFEYAGSEDDIENGE